MRRVSNIDVANHGMHRREGVRRDFWTRARHCSEERRLGGVRLADVADVGVRFQFVL
jgi:hypothetical protein